MRDLNSKFGILESLKYSIKIKQRNLKYFQMIAFQFEALNGSFTNVLQFLRMNDQKLIDLWRAEGP